MDDPQMIIVTPRRRGRPRAIERKVPLMSWVPPAYYDRITKMARAEGEHVSTFVCRVLEDAIRRDV